MLLPDAHQDRSFPTSCCDANQKFHLPRCRLQRYSGVYSVVGKGSRIAKSSGRRRAIGDFRGVHGISLHPSGDDVDEHEDRDREHGPGDDEEEDVVLVNAELYWIHGSLIGGFPSFERCSDALDRRTMVCKERGEI